MIDDDVFTILVARGVSPQVAVHVEQYIDEAYARHRAASERLFEVNITWYKARVLYAACIVHTLATALIAWNN